MTAWRDEQACQVDDGGNFQGHVAWRRFVGKPFRPLLPALGSACSDHSMEGVSSPRRCKLGVGMFQTYYSALDIRPIVVVGPKGPDMKEIMPDGNFQRVMPFARMSKQDCRLDKIIE